MEQSPKLLRLLMNPLLESRESILLLDPRQTGKSTLMRSLNPDLELNLADESTFLAFLANGPVAPCFVQRCLARLRIGTCTSVE